ncbi:hypothetical protein [Fervidobacterium sp.]
MTSKRVDVTYFGKEGKYFSSPVRMLLNVTNLVIIFLNLITVFFYGLRIENFIVLLISAIMFYIERRNFPEVVIFTLAYPLSWLFFIPLKNEEIEDFFNIPIPPEIRLNIDESIKVVLPVKTILFMGITTEKKAVARQIVNYVIHGIDIEENMKYLRILIKDSHMDVALYAGQANEDIENYFESRIAKPENSCDIELCLLVYRYLRTGIPKGVLKEKLESLLRNKLDRMSDRIPQYYEFLYYLTKKEDYFLEGYNKTNEPELLRKYLLEKLRKREYILVKNNLNEVTKILLCEPPEQQLKNKW